MSSNNTSAAGGVSLLFQMLDSNKLEDVEDTKSVLHKQLMMAKDNWLVNGLFDYYLSTNSLRVVEVLAGVNKLNSKYLFDKLLETLNNNKSPNNLHKINALTFLGHLARCQPTWLYKIASHPLFKSILCLLKVEEDILLMSALLLLVTLLPMFPTALNQQQLQEIFEVFFRVASLHYQYSSNSSTNAFTCGSSIFTDKDQFYFLHLQIGMYNLFHRLYAMYPFNLILFLNQKYNQRESNNLQIFKKTINPMLDSVRMHPLLVTMSKEAETSLTRWKNMELHDVVVECERFTLDKCRDEPVNWYPNSRFTPISDRQNCFTPVNQNFPTTSATPLNGEEDSFWSPSMMVPPHSPPPLQTAQLEPRSTPSTPGNNIRSRTSPPEAAIEATPETTPIKDLRQPLSRQQIPVNSSAVRSLGGFGNGILGSSSRPQTPSPLNLSNYIGGDQTLLSQKLGKVFAERQLYKPAQNTEEDSKEVVQNGKSDSWQEDQEVSDIVSSGSTYAKEKVKNEMADLSIKLHRLQFSTEKSMQVNRAKSCPDIEPEKNQSILSEKKLKEDTGTQTCDNVPYEHLLLDLLSKKCQAADSQSYMNMESRLSPSAMLERYIEVCARTNSFSERTKPNFDKLKLKKKQDEDLGSGTGEDENSEMDRASQKILLMQMQVQFERQRREVHAHRNRRLLGTLRSTREEEEIKSTLEDRLRLASTEIEALKKELDQSKRETRNTENKYTEAVNFWQKNCKEEQQRNSFFKEKMEQFETDLKKEKQKVNEAEKETKNAKATLFEAAHQLKEALKAVNKTEELKRILDSVQKRFLLLGEAQLRITEKSGGPQNNCKQEAALVQKSYTEELTNLRRQIDTQLLQIESLKSQLVKTENKNAEKELLLTDLQRSVQEIKEKHAGELEAVESKYKAQVEINLLLESRILELLGKLETATITAAGSSAAVNLASSVSPKERSPALSASLASSSEGSLAFIHSGPTGIIMNDICDSAGEIPNLQAIVEPEPSQNANDSCDGKSLTKLTGKNDEKNAT